MNVYELHDAGRLRASQLNQPRRCAVVGRPGSLSGKGRRMGMEFVNEQECKECVDVALKNLTSESVALIMF